MVPGSRKWAKSYRQIRYISLAPILHVRGRHFCNYFLSPCLSMGTGAVSKKCGNSAGCYSAVGTIPQAALLQNEKRARKERDRVLPLFASIHERESSQQPYHRTVNHPTITSAMHGITTTLWLRDYATLLHDGGFTTDR